MSSGWRYPLFWVILAVYLLAGVLYATLTPPWQSPDEPAHYNYVDYLVEQGSFPVLVSSCYSQAYLQQLTSLRFPPQLSIHSLCYESHQPPLYYLLAVPIFFLTNGSLTALRLLSVILGGGVVALAFFIGQTIFPNRVALAFGTMAFVAFGPMHVAVLASVNNDALAELILAGLLLLLTRLLMSGPPATYRYYLGLGVLLGLGLITKTTTYIAIPLVAVSLWLAAREKTTRGEAVAGANRGHMDWPGLVGQAALIYGVALLIAVPWYVRNATLYGQFDLLGLFRHNTVVVGQPRTADFMAEMGRRVYLRSFITTTFQSFWGQFGWMAVPWDRWVYLILALFTFIAGAGVLVAFYRSSLNLAPPRLTFTSAGQHHALGLMALTVGLITLGYGWYNLTFVQFQGRYLFPALIPMGLFFTIGLYEANSERWAWWLVGGFALALVGGAIISSMLTGRIDKWVVLITGLACALAIGRAWLTRRWPIPAWWLLSVYYIGLAWLSLISPFWVIIPYLSP